MMQRIFTLLTFVAFVVTTNAQADSKFKIATVAFYNLENLFDTIDSPDTDDAEFLPGGINRWDTERYNEKQENMGFAISQIGTDLTKIPPMILGVSEIENEQVLLDLVQTKPLKPFNYKVVHY
ncbi:MAG: endonuclease/exonuclease/phosphatase family protein, partial [Salinivirgaceae bacterium]|nr:endonuclease/exonuclease/phosphatase family protein [Salinivirgaceae bacterium]